MRALSGRILVEDDHHALEHGAEMLEIRGHVLGAGEGLGSAGLGFFFIE